LVEDVYLLVVPTATTHSDPKEEEERAQAAKAERLENAELLHIRTQPAETQGISFFFQLAFLATHLFFPRLGTISRLVAIVTQQGHQ
jgi:hypothetical protein